MPSRKLIAAALLALAGGAAQAAPYFWTDWTGSDLDAGVGFRAQGTITTPSETLTVTYSNPRGHERELTPARSGSRLGLPAR